MLEVIDARVRFDGTPALDGASLTVGEQVMAVLGPSGSGKSTLLRVVAGLQALESGTVRFDGEDITSVPPHRRRFGLMFQDYALFPHRTVGRNVSFGLEMQGLESGALQARTAEVLELVGLSGMEDRDVEGLSGGEAQRVALARTLAPHPRLILLDEPMGALDRMLRERLVAEVREILVETGTPAVYVTHDHAEAEAVADRVAIMRDGRVLQVGSLAEIRSEPSDPWVARFVAS